jgi:Sec-independent protein secretion pathway component TatC
MFYIIELIVRVKYIIFSFFFLFLICLINSNNIILLVIQPIFKYKHLTPTDFYFIYTNPTELYVYSLYIVFFMLILVLLPFVIWQIKDFFKTSLYSLEYDYINRQYVFLISYFLVINFGFPLFFLPKIWCFLDVINLYISDYYLFNIFLELKINEYFLFLIKLLYYVNLSFITLYIYISLIVKFDYTTIIFFKKIFIFVNLLLATFLSPPEVLSQVLFLVLLTLFLEIIIFSVILSIKILNKVTY